MRPSIVPIDTVGLVAGLFLVLACQSVTALTLAGSDGGLSFEATDAWRVRFDPKPSTLELVHRASGARIAGKLSFAVEIKGHRQPWSIIPPRDRVPTRLGLLDGKGNVQGYVTFSGSGGTLCVTTCHRPEQAYRGTLTFRATAQLGGKTFACRTRPRAGSRVVQMASGPARSGLNRSLFDIDTDTVLRLKKGSGTFCASRPSGRSGKRKSSLTPFLVEMTATPGDAAHSTLVFEVIRDYYRSRYVPYYQPINKKRCPSAPTGWLSWNVYFDTAGEKGNLHEARVAAKHLKPFGLEFWSIESWQENSDVLPVSKFHTQTLRRSLRKFPHEMKWLAAKIRELGFRPGIWTVPFGTGDKDFYEAHKGWFLHDADGKPMQNWSGLYVLDPSQEAVRRHVEANHRTISQAWGYEYWKIDGLSARDHHKSAHFFERPEVRAAFKEPCEDPLRLCIEALRRGIGPDSIWVGCGGHYTGPEVGFIDTARLGADIVSGSYRKPPPKWRNYFNQARMTLNQLFVHNIIWYNDPDTLMVGGTPLNVARVAATVVGLPGQVTFAGDKLGELPAERMRLLQQCLPVCDVRPLDLFPLFELHPIWDLKIDRPFGRWDVVSLFNWGDQAADVEVRFVELGLPGDAEYLVYDFWGRTFRGSVRDRVSARLPGRSNLLLAVHPSQGRPQFLSTDRHITQGGVSLEDLRWDDASRVLSGSVRLVENVPSELVFFVPTGYELVSVKSDGADEVNTKINPDRTVTVTLRRATSGPARWRMAF